MSENNSSLPQLNQGDPSDLSRPVESKPIKPGKLSSPFAASGVLKMDTAPGQTFANNPLSGTIDAPTIAGTQGFMGDITAPNERDSWFDDTSVGANLIMTGGNVNDPRLNSQMSNQAKFLNDQMKIWETSGDRARNAIFGGALQGINRIGEDIGGILGGSFWGEDFEKSAMERYFANSRPTYETQTKIYDQDAKFWQGTQAVVSSIVEFAPVGGAVTKGFSLGAKAVKGVTGAVRGVKAARATTKFSEAIARGTRVSEAVAQNSSRLGNFYKKFQNPINQVGTAVPAGIVQNRIEGTAMGLQTYNEVLEELAPLIDSGELSYEQAAKIASDAGNSVRATNSSMMLQDIFQHATLFRARGLTRTGYQRPGFTWNPKQYLKNAFKSRKSAWNYGTNNFIVQGIGEGLEEGLQSGIQQDAITNAKRAGREILRETGDVTKLSIDNLATATKSNVLDRYLDYMSTDDAKFEMAIGFFAGGGQRMVQSYTEKAFDGSKYRKFTKEIEAVKKNLPSGTDEEATYKRQKIEELEYKRSIETERGRSEAAQELLNNLSGDVANSIKFAMETDDLLEAVQKKGMEHLANGIEKNAFYNLFMKHAQNGTVDQLERQLQAIADGSSTSAIFPGDGSAKQKASEFLKELNGLEGDYLSVQNMEGAHTIMGKQFLTQTNERIIDDAIAARSTAKAKVIEDLRRISKSKATSIELDEETGKVTLKDSQGRELKLSKALEKAMQASEEYLEIFGEGGFNDQIDAIKDRVIADRISLADMISDSGQLKIKEERKEFEKELERLRKVERKKGRTHSRKGKTKGQRDASNLDNQHRRANDAQTRMEGDEITSKATMPPQSNNPSPSDENPNPKSAQEIKELFEPGKDSLDIKSDKEIQEAAEGTFESTQTDPKYGYNRGRKSNLNKVATLLRQWNATVNKGVIFLNDADFKFIDGYMSLSDPTSVQEGDELIFEVVSDEEAGDYPVTDVSDLDATNQGKKTTVKEVRANRKKSLAGHESDISQTEITEDQIIKDTQPIKIWHVSKDGTGTRKLIGFVHTPLYEREARQDQKEGEDKKDYNARIAEYKQKIREFRDKLINGDVTSTRISEINAVILNYISKDNRQSTAKTFNGVDSSKYTIALSRTNGELFTNSVDEDGKGASVGIQSKAGIGRNSVIINQKDVQAGMAYVVVPLKKDKEGNIHYYAAPLLTRTVTDNNVAVMQTAIKNWISSTNVEGLQSNMTAKDVRNLKTVLKRFIRIRSTSSLPNKPNQSYVYEKEVEGKKVLVFAKVLTKASEGNNGIHEVALEKDMPLSEENLKFVNDVLAEQMGNMDFDSIDSNEHYHSTMDKDGNITTTKKSFTDHVMENTLSTIGPVRAEVKQGQTQGELPNGRAIFHYNPEIRFVEEGAEGTEAQEKPPLKEDDDPQPGMDDDLAAIAALAESLKITEDQVKDDMEAAELLAEEEEEEDNPLDEGDDGNLGLLPESATKRTEETRNKHRLPNISAVEQEQIVGHFASDVIAQLKIILDNAQVERSDKDSFDLAVDETYQQLLRNMEALQKRTRALITAANKFNKTDLAKKYENRRKKIERIITSLRNNDEKLIDLAMTRLDTQSGVTRREGKQAGADPTVTSLFDSIFGGKKTKSEELEEDSDEDTGGAAPGINKSHHAENFYFTLDPIDTASSRMRDSLSTLVQLNKKGGFAKTFFGTNSYADPNQVFKVLSTALDGTKPIFSEQMDVLIRKYLSDTGFRNKAPWLPALVLSSVEVKSLEASPLGQKFLKKVLPNVESRAASIKELQQLNISPQIMNEFSSVMAKHTLVAPMISIRTGKDGQVYVNAFSQNRNALIKVVSEEFEKGMRSKLYHYDASTGDYTINEEAFTKGIEYLKELAQTEGDVLRDDFIVQMEAKLGITLSEDAVDTLFDNGIYLETTKTGRRVKFANSKMWNNNRSPFGIMQRHLESLLSKKTAYSIKGPTNFGAIDRLIKLEAHRSSAKRHGTTFFSGGRNIATMTSNKYFSNLLDDLFNLEEDSENPELSEKIVNKAHEIFGGEFEKPSQLLQAIYDGLITRENLEVQYINFSPLKQGKDSSDDFRRLEEAEHAAVKNGLMTYSTNITSTAFESSSEYSEGTHTFKMRQATIVPLTLSDKNTVMALKTLVPIMKFDPDGNISNSTVNLFVNNVVMSDINRIRAFASSNSAKDSADKNTSLTDVNNSSFEEGSLLFYLLPQLNNVMVEVDGVQRSLNEAVAAASLDSQMKELMPEIIKAVKPILNSMIDDKVEAFDPIDGIENYEHIPSAYKNMIMEQSSLIKPDGVDLLEFYKSNKVLMRMVAADITLGQALGTANTLQTFVGDIAQYYKPGKESTIREAYEQEDGSPETTAAIKATYENLDKRLASLIAPGVEPSRKNDNEEYIQIMVPDIMMDYDDEFFEGLSNEYLKAFKNTESTDGQEFVTWEEYLGNAVAFGEITQNVSDKITSLIKKYERGYIMKPEDKELLKKVMFNAQKPVAVSDYYTKIGSIGKTVRQRAYIKTSSVPLLPMFTKGTQLDNVRQAMENLQESQGMRVRLAFKSGVKVGYPAASKNASIVNSDGTVKSIEELTTLFKGNDETGIPYRKLKRKYWRIQQSVPNKKKDESTRGTQPDALIGAAASEVKALKTVVEELTENANQLFKLRVEEIRGTLLMDNPDPNKKGEKIIDREKLGGMLKLVALERGFDFNVIEGLSVAEDGTFEVPAELSPASEQFQAMLLSIVRKGVAKKKVTGGSKVLMTEALFRFEEDTDQGEILYTSKYEGSLKPMRIETVVTEEGVSEVVQPAQIIIPNKMRLPNGKLIDFTKYIDKKTNRIDLSKLPEGALEGMGFRIPTQGYNSMAFVEVVGFLPEYMGDIVIAPRSFITQMGSDFDVDKLYEYFFKLETKKGSLVKVEDKVNNVDGQMEYTELGLQNAMLANRLTILKNNEVYRKIKKKLDFGLHTDVSNYKNTADEAMTKDINFYGGMANALEAKRKATSKSKRSVLSEFYQRKKYLEARSALDAVGVKASLNSFVGVITSTEKSINLIKPFTFGADAQVANIEGALTLRGTRLKQEVISGTLSAAVDNQNEQVINKYNLNNQTFDVHDALELMGFEEDFIQSFLEQPIILAVVAQVRKNEFETLNSVIEKAIAYFAKEEFGSDFSEIDVNKAVTKKFNAEFGDLSMDEVVAKLYNNVGKTFTEENNLLNIAMLEKFRHAKAIMSQLRPAVKILSGDSQGVGSTLAEFVGILQKVEELNGSDDGMPNVIDPTSVLGLMGKYLLIPRSSKIKIKNAKKKGFIPVGIIGGAQYLVKPDSVKAAGALHTLSLTNDLIMSEFSGMFNLINTVSTRAVVRGISVEGKKTISQGIRSYINSNADLFTEDEVTTTLEQLLYPTDTTMSLAEMLEVAKKDSRLKGNKLIQDLETAIEEDRPHTISFRNSANDDMVTDSQAIAFLDLLLTKSDTPIGDIGVTPKQLARKLIDYAFLTGGRKSAVDFVRFVPTSYLIDLGFFKTLKEGYAEIKGSEGAQHTNAMVQQILQHNPDLVTKRIRIKQEQSAEENEKGEGVVLNEDSSNGESIIFSPQKGLIEKAGISMGDTGLYMVHSSYDYIAVKPAGNPRRVLKFDHNTGNYVMLDNLGTGTISEYEFGKGTKESVLIENKSSTYFSNETASQEDEEEIIPTEAGGGPTISITNQGTIPTASSNEDILTKIKNTFEPPSSDGPKEENPVKPPVEEKPSTTTTQPPKEEVDFDALFKSGSSKEKKEIPTSGEENQSLPSLAAVSKKLEGSNSGFYSPTESEVVQMLEEISESADMTHKYLAREILNSGVLGKKQFNLIFKSGNTLESNFNKKGQKVTINIDSNTSNWDFEQTVLHEIGHALTAFEIARFIDTPNSVSPKMKASLEKLDTLRKLFLKKLKNKSRQEIENYLAFTKDSESEIQDKIRELHAAGDVAAIQKILMAGYGASNLDEFVTMVMSNGAFRDMLDNTIDFNLTDGSVDKSLLVQIMSVLKDMFRQIFGLEKRKISEYALDQAMFVAKNQYTGTDTGYTDDSETVVLRSNGKQYTYNGSSVIDSASNVVTDKKILNQVERKLALSRNNSTKVLDGGKEYYVYEGFNKIEVARVNKNGTVTKLKPAEADKIIAKAFVGSDGIITGGKLILAKQPAKQTSEVEVVSRYTNADVKANPDKIYIFGDNTERRGTGGQAQIRNNENAFGIATKVSPKTTEDAYFSDSMGYAPMQIIEEDIARIKADGRPIVFPKDGFGTGLAKLKEKAPQTYAYLKQRLQEEFGFNNDTGVVSKPTQQSTGTKPAPLQQRKVEVTRSDIPSNLLGEQREAAQLIMDFLDDPSGPQEFSLVGKAGTGKTTTISSIIKAYQKKVRGKIVIGALSHKATQVIEGSIKEFYESSNEALNNKKIEFNTVASMMGLKLDEETNEFEEDRYTPNKLGSAGLVIIDESSMINEEALEKLKSRLPNSSKIIFLGDSGQLSPIRKSKAYRQGKYKVDKSAISPIFTSSEFGDTNSFKLLTRRRQGEDSKILPFADFFWDEAHKSSEASNYPAGKDQRVNSEELKFVKTEQDALVESYPIFEKAVKDKNPNLIKVIAYRNATVKRVNNDIRNAVLNFPTDGIVEGEIMVANGSFIVESEHGSRGGRVSNPINPELTIEITNSTQIIVGKVSEKQTYEVDGKAFGYYMVEIQQGQNLQSVPVLDPGSAEKWAAYKKSLWNAAFTAKRNKTSNAKQLMAKAAGSTYRTFAPFDYGYAITSHKSQGSGYDNVIVHEADIYSVAPTSNAQKHRSMYTAITRARKNAIIIDRGDVKVSTPSTTTSSGDQGYDLFGNRLGLLPLQGTVDEFLRELDPAERRFFNQLSKEGKLKTICKLG